MKGVRMKTRIVELIITDDRRGSGLDGDPVRIVSKLFTKDGDLVAEVDPLIRDRFQESRDETECARCKESWPDPGVVFFPWRI